MSKFRQSDVTRFVRAVEKATGQKATAVEKDAEGKITVIVGKPGDAEHVKPNPWDKVLNDETDQKWPA